jgi:N-acetylglutamate synthase/N-acetylornithine aminotransferase
MKEYNVTFVYDYCVIMANPVLAEDEEFAIEQARAVVLNSGIYTDGSNYVEVEENYG